MAFWRSYAHIVWATKNREPLIRPHIESEIYAYIISKAVELNCYIHAINGVEDHIHLIISIPPKHSVAWVVKTLKGSSSHFVNNTLHPQEFHFVWQRGYGYLTLGESQCPRAITYVKNQKERHRQRDVNAWLERYSEFDEGPDFSTAQPGDVATRLLRETLAEYTASSPTPF